MSICLDQKVTVEATAMETETVTELPTETAETNLTKFFNK